jgi:hypothetical protein
VKRLNSFPGEYRAFVAQVAEYLVRKLGRQYVSYDRYYEADLARPNLHEYLREIYTRRSDLLIVLLCSEYEKKDWCRVEWGAIHLLIESRQDDQVMFIRLDDGDVSGVVPTDGYRTSFRFHE